MSTESEPIAAAFRSVSKRFGVTQALTHIDLEIRTGTIHVLVGENGAGKSTALGILAGRLAPSSGAVELFGRPLPSLRPRESRRLGLAAIYQELTIAPDLNAEANVFLGQTLSTAGWLASRRMRRRYEQLCDELGVPPVSPRVRAGALSVADQQLLEIMRAMATDARIILFDEPTAALGMAERRALLDLLKRMRANGRTVVFVSHNLDEVLEVADTVTVFQGGRLVMTKPRAELVKRDLVHAMLGEGADRGLLATLEDAEEGASAVERPVRSKGPTLLRVKDLSVPGAVEGLSFELHTGELLGLGGLVGSGRTTTLRALAGLEPRATGRLWIGDREVPWPRSVRKALSYGIALAPEDRKTQGLVLELPAELNVTMSNFRTVSTAGWMRRARVRAAAERAVTPFGFDPLRVGEPPIRLSGGNQQKLLLARWKHAEPRILLADEPTRGIDIGAKQDVLSALADMTERGLGVIVVSSELEELVAACDRVEVLAEGRNAGTIDRDRDQLSVSAILDKAFSR